MNTFCAQIITQPRKHIEDYLARIPVGNGLKIIILNQIKSAVRIFVHKVFCTCVLRPQIGSKLTRVGVSLWLN